MDCKHVRDLLSAYHEGHLAPRLRAELKRHLTSCPQCASIEKESGRLHESLLALFEARGLPEDFERRVLGAISTRRSPAASRRRLAAWASIAAVAFVGITLIFVGFRHGETPRPDQEHAAAVVKVRMPEPAPAEPQVAPETKGGRPDTREVEEAPVRRELPAEIARKKPAREEPREDPLAGKAQPDDSRPGESDKGHGKPGNFDGELLASPLEREGERPGNAGRKRPGAGQAGPAGPRRARPGTERPADRQRPTREELAEKARERREAERAQGTREIEKLEPEERRRVASAIKESSEGGVPALSAARVVHLVFRSGRGVEDAVKAVRALNAAAGKGVPPRRFAAGLERLLRNAPKDADLEKMLKRLVESLSNGAGKTN